MIVCIDKITCARMLELIGPKWKTKAAAVRAEAQAKLTTIASATDDEAPQVLHAQRDRLLAKAAWMDETIIGRSSARRKTKLPTSSAGALTSSPTAR